VLSIHVLYRCLVWISEDAQQQDSDLKTMVEYKKCLGWNECKKAIEVELCSLKKRKVLINVIPTPIRIFPIRFKWVSVLKRNENNEVVRYKVKLVAQVLRRDLDLISKKHILML
jgi:hypothetical protein